MFYQIIKDRTLYSMGIYYIILVLFLHIRYPWLHCYLWFTVETVVGTKPSGAVF
jgi:hypothetical protein